MSQLDSALDSLLDASSGPVAGPGLKEVGRSGDETRLKAGGMTRQGSSGKLPQPRRGSRYGGPTVSRPVAQGEIQLSSKSF